MESIINSIKEIKESFIMAYKAINKIKKEGESKQKSAEINFYNNILYRIKEYVMEEDSIFLVTDIPCYSREHREKIIESWEKVAEG